jgi:Mg2+/Co2+ transporter CorB
MNTSTLLFSLFILLLLSAFFSSSETGLMSINRLKLRHLAETSKSARRALKLLEHPDRLLGVILLGNNFVNILAASISSFLFIRWFGENIGLILNSVAMTLIVLIFAEVSPKTVAALYPEKIALPASKILSILLKVLSPLVWLVNYIANSFLKLLGIKFKKNHLDSFNLEELRTVVIEASKRIPPQHRDMLLGIIDLEKACVEDIMIPRNEVVGIDLDDDFAKIIAQLSSTQHTLLPVFRQDLNNFIGILHIKKALTILSDEEPSEQKLIDILDKGYFVPEGTNLADQLIHFRSNKRRLGFVVDEYGEILGIVTIEDILEEIVGNFTTNAAEETNLSHDPQTDGSILMDGGTLIKDANLILNTELPTDGPKTISGLIISSLELIPPIGTCCLLEDHPIEVLQVQENKIKTIKVFPRIMRDPDLLEE